jgi:malate synthase
MGQPDGVSVTGPMKDDYAEILTEEALAFVAGLQRQFGDRRRELLERRDRVQAELDAGGTLDFLAQTRSVRDSDWKVAEAPPALRDRRVEITGPTDKKMLINALNSGAKVFMADFEDSNTPTWDNLIQGQRNLIDAIERRLEFTSPEGAHYALGANPAVLIVRTRGWHLPEKHLFVDGEPISGALFDFGLYFFHNAQRLLDKGAGPYFYLPKLESHLEARLWNEVFNYAQDALGLPRGTIRATVLAETIPAAFEMEEILYELRDHSSGINAGRWDYIFSVIKKFRNRGQEFLMPDRNDVTMTVPFMRAYSELVVSTCHRRGAHAIGGMAAFIPSRRDPEVNEKAMAKVRDDKQRDARDGYDGSWVAHPDLVSICLEAFDATLGERPNQLDRQRDDVHVTAQQLLDVASTPAGMTEGGLRNDVSVGLQYLESWLRGTGAVGIFNLMEDAATAEISRSQVWQWLHNDVTVAEGQKVTPDLVRRIIQEELDKIRATIGEQIYDAGRFKEAQELFEQVALDDKFEDFLTLPAYQHID